MVNCPTCGGSGQVQVATQMVKDGKSETVYVTKDCGTCGGMGVIPGIPV